LVRVIIGAQCTGKPRPLQAFREYPAGEARPQITLCGRNSVQIHERSRRLDLDLLSRRLAAHGDVRSNAYLLRLRVPPYELTLFADGRAIIGGTTDPAIARSLYARYVGV